MRGKGWQTWKKPARLPGSPGKNRVGSIISDDFLKCVPLDIFFDYMAILLDGLNPEVRKFTASIKMIVEDHESELERELVLKYYELNVENCVINHTQLDEDDEDNAESIYDTTVNIKKMTLYNLVGAIAAGTCTNPSKVLKELKDNNDITISGDEWRFVFILNHLQALDVNFNLVTPVDLCR